MDEGSCWRRIVHFFFLTVPLCAAQDSIQCHTYTEPGKTTYVIQIPPNSEEMDCDYSWNNATDYVLANRGGQEGTLVLTHTNASLVTSACIEVIYMRSCISGGRNTTVCVVNCTEALKNRSIKVSRSYMVPCIIIIIFIIITITITIALVAKVRHECAARRRRRGHVPMLAGG